MNTRVITNYSRLTPPLFILPIVLLLSIVGFLYNLHSLQADRYVQVQKDSFYFINHHLGQYPKLLYNITQLGDASICFSFLSIFLLYAPKIWESLISASLVSLIFSSVLKTFFAIPRPAVVFDNNSFIIIGNKAVGFASLPSGHSITIFTTLTILLFAFMPNGLKPRIALVFLTIITGLLIAFTRVGVGAHYPLDVIVGSTIGYISALIGIFINQRFTIWTWMENKKYYPILMLLMLLLCASLINKIITENLIIYYFALISLVIPFYKITYAFVKK